jgi:hypothetical protein
MAKETPESKCLNPSYEKKMCARFTIASNRELVENIAVLRKDQSTKIVAIST